MMQVLDDCEHGKAALRAAITPLDVLLGSLQETDEVWRREFERRVAVLDEYQANDVELPSHEGTIETLPSHMRSALKEMKLMLHTLIQGSSETDES
jgi:hypothetical protein